MRTIPQLLALDGYEKLSRQERWHIIDEIDQQIDYVQRCQRIFIHQGISYATLEDEVLQLRTKRVLIWLSFNTNLSGAVRLAA